MNTLIDICWSWLTPSAPSSAPMVPAKPNYIPRFLFLAQKHVPAIFERLNCSSILPDFSMTHNDVVAYQQSVVNHLCNYYMLNDVGVAALVNALLDTPQEVADFTPLIQALRAAFFKSKSASCYYNVINDKNIPAYPERLCSNPTSA